MLRKEFPHIRPGGEESCEESDLCILDLIYSRAI